MEALAVVAALVAVGLLFWFWQPGGPDQPEAPERRGASVGSGPVVPVGPMSHAVKVEVTDGPRVTLGVPSTRVPVAFGHDGFDGDVTVIGTPGAVLSTFADADRRELVRRAVRDGFSYDRGAWTSPEVSVRDREAVERRAARLAQAFTGVGRDVPVHLARAFGDSDDAIFRARVGLALLREHPNAPAAQEVFGALGWHAPIELHVLACVEGASGSSGRHLVDEAIAVLADIGTLAVVPRLRAVRGRVQSEAQAAVRSILARAGGPDAGRLALVEGEGGALALASPNDDD